MFLSGQREIVLTVDLNKLPYDATSQSFTYKLPHPLYIDINDDWIFYAHSFIYPTYFHNLQRCAIRLAKDVLPPNNILDVIVPSDVAFSPANLCEHLNSVMEHEEVREFCNTGAYKAFTFSLVSTGARAGQIKINPNARNEEGLQMLLNHALAEKIGFNVNDEFEDQEEIASKRPNLNYGQELLYLYCDIIQNRVLDKQYCKLVDVFPFKMTEKTSQAYPQPYYQSHVRYKYGTGYVTHKVDHSICDNIGFKLLHENGESVKWVGDGPCLLTFCLKRTPCFT